MGPVISVIVPVYKVEPYLSKCIESVCDQTFRDLEIILVDDGSPDNCGQICEEYAAKDSRIRVIHKENGGLSSARNAGMDIARGEFFGFVDSDDWIEPDMFAFLYSNLVKEDADISVCGRYEHLASAVKLPQNASLYAAQSPEEAIRSVLMNSDVGMFAWNKLFRRHLFSQIRFPEGRIYEDAFVMLPLMDAARKIVFHMEPKYHYLRREGSITMRSYRPEMRDMVDVQLSNYQYVCSKHPSLSPRVRQGCLWAHMTVLDAMLMSSASVDEEDKQKYIRFLRENKNEILRNPVFTVARKLSILALCVHESLYKIMVKLQNR